MISLFLRKVGRLVDFKKQSITQSTRRKKKDRQFVRFDSFQSEKGCGFSFSLSNQTLKTNKEKRKREKEKTRLIVRVAQFDTERLAIKISSRLNLFCFAGSKSKGNQFEQQTESQK